MSVLRRLAAGVALGLTFAGTAMAQTVTLRFHSFIGANSYQHVKFFDPWCARIKEQSNGRLVCQMYPSMQLGGSPGALYDQARDGVVDIVYGNPGYSPGAYLAAEVFELPFMLNDVVNAGRRTSRFVTESPVLNFFSVQSARYERTARMHNGVEMVVFHDAAHDRNVPRMLDALSASLDYFQANFSPYQFRQARIVEFPDYASFAQSYPNTFAWSEGLGFIADLSDPTKVDYVTYVGAHEFAHQWWAHQVVGSNQQGMTVLSETLAQYSALMVMEKMYGKDQIRRFLKQELDRYLRARGTERLEEMPLMRVENQGYIHYQKGGLIMYLLRDQIGEEAVNRALRRVLAQYAFRGAPYPRSLDLIAAIRAEAPADKQALITDLFEKITLYDVKTTGVTATRRADGRWDVAVTVDARKLYADGEGVETPSPLNEVFDVGIFAAEPGKAGFDEEDVVLLERRPIRSGVQTLRFITTREPRFAGVDPYNKWIDRDSNDNVRAVG